jgi:L-2-hydroxyglutarate oxidase LhgO
MRTIETDYLVVGAGAMGMAFTDTVVSETDATIVIVDRGHSQAATGSQPTHSCGSTSRQRFTV